MPEDLGLASALAGTVRLLSLFLVAPMFGHRAIPARLRMAFALAVAGSLGGLTGAASIPDADTSHGLTRVILGEALLGFSLGFATRLVFAGFSLMGEIISVQGGLGAANVLDPASGASTPAMASLTNLFAILALTSLGGDHALLQSVVASLERIPVGSVALDRSFLSGIAGLGFVVFEVAVKLAMPVTCALMLANLSVGILGRTIPQLNLMTVQLPALLGLTFLLLTLGGEAFVEALSRTIEAWIGRVAGLMLGAG